MKNLLSQALLYCSRVGLDGYINKKKEFQYFGTLCGR